MSVIAKKFEKKCDYPTQHILPSKSAVVVLNIYRDLVAYFISDNGTRILCNSISDVNLISRIFSISFFSV